MKQNNFILYKMFQVIKLPYSLDALSEVFTEENMYYHYEKHHKGYAKKLNELAEVNPRLKRMSLEEIVQNEKGPIYNNASQILNHDFFWQCMTPKSRMTPFVSMFLTKLYGSVDKFKEQFEKVFMSGFGSYWTWFVYNDKGFQIVNTQNADVPMGIQLLISDGWEHNFYLTYFNDKQTYIKNWWKVVNWDFLEKNIKNLL